MKMHKPEEARLVQRLAELAHPETPFPAAAGGPGPGWALRSDHETLVARPWHAWLDLSLLDGRDAERIQKWLQGAAAESLYGMSLIVHDAWVPLQWAPTRVSPAPGVSAVARTSGGPSPVLVLVAAPSPEAVSQQHLARSASAAELAFRSTYGYDTANFSDWVWVRTFRADDALMLAGLGADGAKDGTRGELLHAQVEALHERALAGFFEDLVGRRDRLPDAVAHGFRKLRGELPPSDLKGQLGASFGYLVNLIRRNLESREAPRALIDLAGFSGTLLNSGAASYAPVPAPPMPRYYLEQLRDEHFAETGEWLLESEAEVLWRAERR